MARLVPITIALGTTDGAGAASKEHSLGGACRIVGIGVNFAAGAAAGSIPSLAVIDPAGTRTIWTHTAGNTDLPLREITESPVKADGAVVATEFRNPISYGRVRASVASGGAAVPLVAVFHLLVETI